MAASAGHDLTIDVTHWSGELTVGADSVPTALEVRIDMTSLAVRSGTGGLKPLTDRDKREITSNARKVLGADRHPEATFSDAKFEPAGGGGVISGTLTLAGRSGPVRLAVTAAGDDRFRATGSVVQSAFGIKPYSGFFGALKVRDSVDLEIDVDLSQSAGGS
jgi:polyisoprenoid-binding protein YceI